MNSTSVPTTAVVDHIDTLAKCYADARKLVATRVQLLRDEQRAAHKRRIEGIKNAIAEASKYQADLTSAIEQHKNLFVQPRTWTLHGIKLGLRKGAGTVKWPKASSLLALLKRTFCQTTCDNLIERVEQPNKEAILKLPAHELKKLGVTIEGTGDFVFVKAVDTEVDKLVEQLLAEGNIEETDAR